MKYDIWV